MSAIYLTGGIRGREGGGSERGREGERIKEASVEERRIKLVRQRDGRGEGEGIATTQLPSGDDAMDKETASSFRRLKIGDADAHWVRSK